MSDPHKTTPRAPKVKRTTLHDFIMREAAVCGRMKPKMSEAALAKVRADQADYRQQVRSVGGDPDAE